MPLFLSFCRKSHAYLSFLWILSLSAVLASVEDQGRKDAGLEIVLLKIGGSSLTNKAYKESLNEEALAWFSQTMSTAIGRPFRTTNNEQCDSNVESRPLAFVVVHGAGSFGHQHAKSYGLKGRDKDPQNSSIAALDNEERRLKMKGLAETRLSVTKLNHLVVSSLVNHGINAVGISPCFGIPDMQAHASNHKGALDSLEKVVRDTVLAGLLPVIHGDACLYGNDAGILSGDVIMKILGKTSWVSHVVFITDVDGVFTIDPRVDPDNALLLRQIAVDKNGDITTELKASGSSHRHDVTGGLKVITAWV
jgi:isopentenyl phosphate kinase